MTNKIIDYNLQTRKNFITLIESLTLDQLNTIPDGYNNNILWNFGHCVVTMQILCYKMSGLDMHVNEDILNEFKKGSLPKTTYSQEELDYLKSIANSSIEQLRNDLMNNLFTNFESYTTSYNATLTNISDAVTFNNIHEGLHLGYAMALKKQL